MSESRRFSEDALAMLVAGTVLGEVWLGGAVRRFSGASPAIADWN